MWNRSLVHLARGFSKGTPSESPSLLSSPKLSSIETLRAWGLITTILGVVGCLFAPDALAFALGGQDWWGRVYDLYPYQRMLEPFAYVGRVLLSVMVSSTHFNLRRCAGAHVSLANIISTNIAFLKMSPLGQTSYPLALECSVNGKEVKTMPEEERKGQMLPILPRDPNTSKGCCTYLNTCCYYFGCNTFYKSVHEAAPVQHVVIV